MRVLLQIRADHRERPGGDATQAARTAEELRLLGVDAELVGGVAPDLAGYDLVHIFNTQVIAEPVRQAIRARRWGLPVVLSPIYWDPAGFRRATRDAAQDTPDQAARDRAEHALQRLTLGAARLLLPNSRAEAAQIAAAFPGLAAIVRVVPNAVDRRYADGDGARFCAAHDLTPRGFVLCAGRKEALKNQLALVEACRALALPLVLAGQETAEAAEYVAACRAAAAGTPTPVLFLPHLGPDDLADAYAAARVHAQPSFYETVGLSSLEAALGGARIVTTANSGAAEYLGDRAWYCDPANPKSIGDALAAAWAAPPLAPDDAPAAGGGWRQAAEETLRGYEEVMRMASDGANIRWLPDLPAEEYVAHLEDLIQLQLEATAARDAQYTEIESASRQLYAEGQETQRRADSLLAEFRALQGLHGEQERMIADLRAGLDAEADERRRVEATFRDLEGRVAEQGAYAAKLEAELAARQQPGSAGRWGLRRRD